MRAPSQLARAAVLMSSFTLLAGYVVYSHITPNSPPPDPLGLSAAEAAASSNTIELTIEPEVVEFDGFINYGTPVPSASAPRRPQELRIISSKVINQPIFSVRNGPFSWRKPSPKQKPKVLLNEFGVRLDGGLSR